MLVTQGVCFIRKNYYATVNKLTLYKKSRWIFTVCLVLLYLQNIKSMSFDIVTYLIGFYLLQLILNYFTPKGINEQSEDQYSRLEESDTQFANNSFEELSRSADKPLIPSLSEIQIWERATSAFIMGIICTCFKMIEVDAFWPLLMIYFLVLVCYTIHKIVTKMEKYRYNFSDFSKKTVMI